MTKLTKEDNCTRNKGEVSGKRRESIGKETISQRQKELLGKDFAKLPVLWGGWKSK